MVSTVNSNTNRISGLASGLETEDLVKKLTQTTSGKIEKAEQQKQILQWKQEYYREISTKLVKFNETYFGSSTANTLIGSSLTQLTATSSNAKYVTVTAGNNASSGSVYISDIKSLATGAKRQSSSPVSPALSFLVDPDHLGELTGKSMNVTLDGITKTITFSDEPHTSSPVVADQLNDLLETVFGEGRVNVVYDDTGNLTFSSLNSVIELGNSGIEGKEALATLGFADGDVSSNRLSSSSTLSSYPSLFGNSETFKFSINNTDFEFSGTTSLNKIISTVNASAANVKMSYSSVTDTFSILSNETGTGSAIVLTDTEGEFLKGIMGGGSGSFTAGTNAEVSLSLDGSTDESNLITIVRSSNTFSHEGTTYKLNGLAAAAEKEAVTVDIALDTESLLKKITQFVSDYNDLLDSITSKMTEEYDRDYQPLTEAEKETLTESEITTLTEKAKTGLLRNDLYLTNIASSLRNSLYTSVKKTDESGDNIDFILADTGITTSKYTENGKLKIDEIKLRKVLAEDPNGVLNLLTQKSSIAYSAYNTPEKAKQRYDESGLLWRLSDIIKNNINSVGKKGALIELAGNPSTGFIGQTTYGKKLSDMDATISSLQDKLADQQDYYWSKFTAMETSINSLNSQSAWLTQQFSN